MSLILLGVAASTCSSPSTSAANDSSYCQLSKEPIVTTVQLNNLEELVIQLVETFDDDSVLTVSPRFLTGFWNALKLLSPTSSKSSTTLPRAADFIGLTFTLPASNAQTVDFIWLSLPELP